MPNIFKNSNLIDAVVSCVVVLSFMAIAHAKSVYPRSMPWLKPDFREHIGAEYDSIALAIRAGRGFSDPFHQPTGPTAWMPPVLPYAMAGVYWASGDDRIGVVRFMIALQGIGCWLACFFVLREARQLRTYPAGLICIALLFAANFYQLFQQTHDTGFLLGIVSLLWYAATRWPEASDWSSSAAWGVWGGFVTLCNPILGGAWFMISLMFARCSSRGSNERVQPNSTMLTPTESSERFTVDARETWQLLLARRVIVPTLLGTAVIAPWTIRNRVQLGRWLPIKSNGMYEVWQSQCLDGDGLLDRNTQGQHPWASAGVQRMRYAEVGEIAFVDQKADLAKQNILESPLGLLERIANRAVAALAYYIPIDAREELLGSGWPMRFVRIVHALPLLAIVSIALFARLPLEVAMRLTVVLFLLLIGPYVLISYYDRYGAMLVSLKALIVLYGWQAIASRPSAGRIQRNVKS